MFKKFQNAKIKKKIKKNKIQYIEKKFKTSKYLKNFSFHKISKF
jgi:hypothetical protein